MSGLTQHQGSDWHPEDIKAAVRKRGCTLAELARRNGLKRQALHHSLRGRLTERGDQIVAEFLGERPQNIWPSRYDDAGNRLRFTRQETKGAGA